MCEDITLVTPVDEITAEVVLKRVDIPYLQIQYDELQGFVPVESDAWGAVEMLGDILQAWLDQGLPLVTQEVEEE